MATKRFLKRYHVGLTTYLVGGLVACGALVACASPVVQEEQAATGPESLQSPAAQVASAPAVQAAPPKAARRPHPGLPLSMFDTENFVGSGRCAVCHEMLEDGAGNDMSISNHWRSTMMANAARDPLWQAKVASEVARNPALKEVIEKKCATCHMPMAYTQASAGGGKTAVFGDQGLLRDGAGLHQAAMDGVSCSLCHQIQEKGLGTTESFSGKFTVDTSLKGAERVIFGPYKDPVERPMVTSVGFTPKYGPQTNDSALCATCHTLFTPYVDAQGNVVGEFPEQTPYLEWLHSSFRVDEPKEIGDEGPGKLCQECHMPHSPEGDVVIARYAPPEVKTKDHFSRHFFVGGNAFMVNLMADNSAELGLTAPTGKLEDTAARTLDLLGKESALLTIHELSLSGDRLAVGVGIESLVGHKFPTGFPSRRTWLHLKVTDGAGNLVFESGRPLADGRVEGDDADRPGAYEPHYQVITGPDQVQIYEAVMGNTDGEVTHTLLRAARYLKDNRLLPRGFDKETAGAEIAVYGGARGDGDFVGGSDRVRYEIDSSGHAAPLRVEAALLYASVSSSFASDLASDGNLAEVAKFGRMYDRADKTPAVVAALQATVE